MAISTNGTVLARLAGGLYNSTMSNATYEEVVATVKTSADVSTFANDLYARDFASKTDVQVAQTLLANLGLSSITGLDNWVAAQLTAAGASGKGAKVVSLLNDFANMTSDATYGSYATAFNAKSADALALSQKAGSLGGDFNAAATLAAAQAAADAAAAAVAAEAAAAAAIAPKSFTLTTDSDAFTGGAGDDAFGASNTTLTAGDILAGGNGADALNLTLNGSPAAVEISGIETVNAKLIASATVDATLWTGVTSVNVGTTSIAAANLTFTGADFATTFSMASGKVNGLSVTYLDGSGTADTAKLSLGGLGSSTADAAVTVTGNTTEAATISTSGKNYVDLTLGTAAKSVTITGSGTNYIDVVTSATSTTIDASANTGALDLDIASGLSAGDVIKAGEATTDKLTATIASTAVLTPTVSGVETFAVTYTAAANLDLKNVTGLKTVTMADAAVNQRLSNVPASVTSITSQETSTSANDIRVDYATGAAATLALALAPSSTATAGVTWDDLSVSNVKSLTISASGAQTVTADAVTADDALTALTVSTSAAAADLALGAITSDELTSVTINATSGDVTIADIVNDSYATVESFTITAADGADVTVTNALDFYDQTTGSDSSLNAISISGGAESVISVNNIVAGANAATDTGAAVEISIALGEDSAGSSIGTIEVVEAGNISLSTANNAGAASEIGLITSYVGDVGAITITAQDDSILESAGVTATRGDIGDVTFTTVNGGLIRALDGTSATTITATAGDVGNVSVTTGNGGVAIVNVTATAGNVGNVTTASTASDTITISAGDTIGDVTSTVTLGDVLTETLTAATLGNVSITGAGSGTVDINATQAGNITVSLTSATASTVTLGDAGSAGTVSVTTGTGADSISLADVESFTVTGFGAELKTKTIIFDGVTYTVAADTADGAATATALKTAYAAATNTHWTVADNKTGTLTFTAKQKGAVTNVTTASFTGDAADLTYTVTVTDGSSVSASTISAGNGTNTVTGGDGNDTITSGTGADSILGGAGADSITSGTGNDSVTGGTGGDSINVGSGTDTVIYTHMDQSASVAEASAVAGTVTISSEYDILTGMGHGDIIDASAAEATDDTIATALLDATDGAGDAAIVRGKYDATAGTWVAGTTDSTFNDYLVQWSDGTSITSVLLVDIVGTVSMTDATGVYTLSVV